MIENRAEPGLWATLSNGSAVRVRPTAADIEICVASGEVASWVYVPAPAIDQKPDDDNPRARRGAGGASLLTVVLLTATAFFTGCGGGGTIAATPVPTVAAPATETPKSGTVIELQGCWDVSSSYPAELRARAMREFGDMLQAMLRPGFPGIRVSEHWITHDSRAPEALLYQFEIAAIPPEPVREVEPPEPLSPDEADTKYIFDKDRYSRDLIEWKEKHAEWETRMHGIDSGYDSAVAIVQAALLAARQTLEVRLSAVSSAPTPIAQGSDVGGCLQVSADQMAHATVPKFIIIASDMAPYGEQDIYKPDLSNVDVYIINYWCDQAIECEERKQFWAETLARAARVDYYKPGENINNILSERTK